MTDASLDFAPARGPSRGPARNPFSKVPEVGALFWIIKVLTTGMGETTSDSLVRHIDPAVAVGLGLAGVVAALALQLAAPRYRAFTYWLAVVMVSVFGTMAADVLHVVLGVPYVASTLFYALALAVILWLWWRAEGTLAIHSIHRRRRELFYWATVLANFALGTAAGDWTATGLGLGFFESGLLFAALIALPALGFFALGLPEVPAFWAAYIVTRPLGASFADWMADAPHRGGLGWGTGPVSAGILGVIVLLVGYLALTRRDAEDPRP